MNWYCLRSQPRRESIAATSLGQLEIEVLYPQIRHRKATRLGALWTTESLFPNYLFAKFDFNSQYRAVKHARGVSTIIHFGDQFIIVPDEVIGELKTLFHDSPVYEIEDDLEVGEEVKILIGPFAGAMAQVMRIKSGAERVRVLFEFLGRKTEVDLPRTAVMGERRMGRI